MDQLAGQEELVAHRESTAHEGVQDRVGEVLDDLHRSAAQADGERYLALFAPGAVFLGTDPSERWGLEAFRVFTLERFATGVGWSYTPTERHVSVSCDGQTAWFDERLEHAQYGQARGTGVLVLEDDWRVAQYSLSFPIPNAVAREVVQLAWG